MTKTLHYLLLLLLAALLIAPVRARVTVVQRHASPPQPTRAGAPISPHQDAHKPNLDLSLYRRSYTPDEKATLRLSGYNVKSVQFTVFRLNLPTLIPTSKALEKFGKPIAAVNVAKLPVAAKWVFALDKPNKVYPDQWAEREVKLPALPGGVYLIRGQAGGAEKRTWYAVTGTALLAKRSRQEILVYAAQAHSGAPQPNLALSLTDERGRKFTGVTNAQGLWRGKTAGAQGNLWIYGAQNGNPAFVLSGAPPPPDPYAVYTFTDRPIYRPGQKVQFTGSIRQRLETASVGGFAFRAFANKTVTVEIRDVTDALISRRTVTTNAYGSFNGDLQLAVEPTLGRWQILVSIGDYHAYTNFEVQAYRKPEYTTTVTIDQSHYLGGSTVPVTIAARYFFGQPVVNATVTYNINFSGASDTEPDYQGQGVTDAQGQLTLQIKTQRKPENRNLSVSATVTDLSRRSESGSAGTLITAGMFTLSLTPDKGVYRPGETVSVLVQAQDYDNKPVATAVKVQLIETKYDNKHRPYQEKTTRNVQTDAAGKATARFTPLRPGYLQLAVQAFDTNSNKIEASGYIWVAGEDEGDYDYPTLDLIPDKSQYRPGQTATILLNTNLVTPKSAKAAKPAKNAPPTHPAAWALVTLEGEGLYAHQLVHLTSRSTVIRVPLTAAQFPAVSLHVTIVQEKHIYEQQLSLSVQKEDQKLQVSVAPDKAKFAPGETATYTVTTRDSQGRPVSAEVALGVVDAAIYAITPDSTPNIESFFYPDQEVRLQTDFSFAAQYSGGAFQTVPSPVASTPAPGGIRVRREFADTAYWNPFVDTGADGTARVSFTVPDNLTTWRATARGMTLDTRVGAATQDTVSTMPLLVRLELPRFTVQGDETVVSAIVHNYTGEARTVKATLQSSGVSVTGDTVQTLQLPANGQQRLEWHTKTDAGASARFLVTADGGPGGQDAMELTLPTLPDGLKMVQSRADALSDASAQQTVNIADLPPGATVTYTLSPSLGAAMFDALDYLTNYPYGCAVQTMSAFLPDVIVARTMRRLKVNKTVKPNLDQWVNVGLQKLYRYQHQDGGWNWWEFDQTDGDMTAYVLWGLIQARDAGFTVDDQRILRGTNALKKLLAEERDPSRQADWLLTLAYASPKDAGPALKELAAKRDALDAYGLASLTLALSQLGGGYAPLARTVAGELAQKAVVRGTSVSWTGVEGGYSWRDDDVDVTAHVLRALMTANPQSNLIPGTVRWLMANRSGQSWNSTKTSSEVVLALAQYLEQTGELHPDFTARLTLDGQSVGPTVRATTTTAFDAQTVLTLTQQQLANHKTLTIDKQGAGILYVTRTDTYLIPPAQAAPQSHGVSVRRTFQITAEDPIHADTIASGTDIAVSVELTADADYRYGILEEPIPAGCEVKTPEDGNPPVESSGSTGYVRQEVRDSKVVFFFDSLPHGKTTVSYTLHAETPGAYRILPSLASLVYFPEVRGNSGLAKAQIGEQP
ncbi:MAG: MG2 domain-containing protein [Armatimonadota bacterium]|nr:MG2 domain-containing protein [Armatimonadota bacterium]